MTMQAFNDLAETQPTEAYDEWLRVLREQVIEQEFGYEEGEFTVFPTLWADLYEKGLSPRDAWQRALNGFAHERGLSDAFDHLNRARIDAEDRATSAEAALAEARREGWRTDEPVGGDARKLVTLEKDGMTWVGIRTWSSQHKRWQNNNMASEKVVGWRDLPSPAYDTGLMEPMSAPTLPEGDGQ